MPKTYAKAQRTIVKSKGMQRVNLHAFYQREITEKRSIYTTKNNLLFNKPRACYAIIGLNIYKINTRNQFFNIQIILLLITDFLAYDHLSKYIRYSYFRNLISTGIKVKHGIRRIWVDMYIA